MTLETHFRMPSRLVATSAALALASGLAAVGSITTGVGAAAASSMPANTQLSGSWSSVESWHGDRSAVGSWPWSGPWPSPWAGRWSGLASGRGGDPGAVLMRRSKAARTEYFHVVSTRPSGPGSIVITGVVNAGGVEKPGRTIDEAVFAGGGFHIDHSAGRPTVRFDPATCVGQITQSGPFKVMDASGDMAGISGVGRYTFRVLYTTARVAGHCSHTTTAYVETINGKASVTGPA